MVSNFRSFSIGLWYGSILIRRTSWYQSLSLSSCRSIDWQFVTLNLLSYIAFSKRWDFFDIACLYLGSRNVDRQSVIPCSVNISRHETWYIKCNSCKDQISFSHTISPIIDNKLEARLCATILVFFLNIRKRTPSISTYTKWFFATRQEGKKWYIPILSSWNQFLGNPYMLHKEHLGCWWLHGVVTFARLQHQRV